VSRKEAGKKMDSKNSSMVAIALAIVLGACGSETTKIVYTDPPPPPPLGRTFEMEGVYRCIVSGQWTTYGATINDRTTVEIVDEPLDVVVSGATWTVSVTFQGETRPTQRIQSSGYFDGQLRSTYSSQTPFGFDVIELRSNENLDPENPDVSFSVQEGSIAQPKTMASLSGECAR